MQATGLRPSKRLLIKIVLAGLLLAASYTLYLDFAVRERFEGKRWELPAKVYARPLELYPGLKLTVTEMNAELTLLGYRETASPEEPGSYCWNNRTLDLVSRPFPFGDGFQESLSLRILFSGDRVQRLSDRTSKKPLPLVRLDPALIGGIYPDKKEDRVLVKLDQVSDPVLDALIAVEDRRFFSHCGIDLRGIGRAIVATSTGDSVQGGSTLTQQLVKNFYLSAERTLQRKLTEMVMALLLELHYDKLEILETYLNEVYLGQDGDRSINGFGLASRFFFAKPVSQLDLHEAALLVGMLKGPSYYNPRSNPQRALQRRNLVLRVMADEAFITEGMLIAAQAEPLGVVERQSRGTSPYPAFLNLVHRQLRQDYRDEDLRSEGLQIFTTFDPRVQRAAERALSRRLPQLEKARGIQPNSLQGALLVTSTQNAEVQAVVGGRDPRFEGFNRALDARRPIGSLIKPIIYLTALQYPERYTLMTRLDDSPLVLQQPGTKDWAPENYDQKFHGEVTLLESLSNSYNVSTVRLGLKLGVSKVMSNLKQFGLAREVPEYASSMLGATPLSPLEVTQIYQTIASGGFNAPLKAIREILTAEGKPLQRYPLVVEQVVEGAPTYLVTVAMQEVVRRGTASNLGSYLPSALEVAGKTGTTDNFRDSWFAGITGDHLAVAWVGRDDNQPTSLTGASGAMSVWGTMMADLNPEPLILPEPENVEQIWVDPVSGLRSGAGCRDAIKLPFVTGSAPTEFAPCSRPSVGKSIKGWFERIFDR
ncbi:penicillin-binding protein 1B [Malonomonas rubra]|uniref:penicillin-binding protein 1B n=1 Tax=Malonomonas rubra TaxID=57040 RepID=UPI0026F35A73|nr:penicillin-binding protein 1B [Malonomonas rubra]